MCGLQKGLWKKSILILSPQNTCTHSVCGMNETLMSVTPCNSGGKDGETGAFAEYLRCARHRKRDFLIYPPPFFLVSLALPSENISISFFQR